MEGRQQYVCEGKARFNGRRHAEKIAKRMRQNHDALIIAYHCRFCGGFHVGNGIPRSKQQRRRRGDTNYQWLPSREDDDG